MPTQANTGLEWGTPVSLVMKPLGIGAFVKEFSGERDRHAGWMEWSDGIF
jgi:hypothetical protein